MLIFYYQCTYKQPLGQELEEYLSDSEIEPDTLSDILSASPVVPAAFLKVFPSPDPESQRKRSKGHPDGPTPMSSPQKKCTRNTPDYRSPPPTFQFSASTDTTDLYGHCNVFGTQKLNTHQTELLNDDSLESADEKGRDNSEESDSDSDVETCDGKESNVEPEKVRKPVLEGKQQAITSYWKVETEAERRARDTRDVVKMERVRERRELEDKMSRWRTKSRMKEGARDRQRKHRHRVREDKIKARWIPGQKHVRLQVPL